MAEQLTLDLALRPALGREDFLVSPSNAEAVALIDQWPQWPTYAAVIHGPAGSGKSHLAHVWQQRARAAMVQASVLDAAHAHELLARAPLIIENVDPANLPQVALFHVLNAARQHKTQILLTSTVEPTDWGITLPDLATRVGALPHIRIMPPDDALLRGVIVKQFSDRQIAVDEALITYLINRMPRSLEMARLLVAEIDSQALRQGAEVTRAFAGKVLARIDSGGHS